MYRSNRFVASGLVRLWCIAEEKGIFLRNYLQIIIMKHFSRYVRIVEEFHDRGIILITEKVCTYLSQAQNTAKIYAKFDHTCLIVLFQIIYYSELKSLLILPNNINRS